MKNVLAQIEAIFDKVDDWERMEIAESETAIGFCGKYSSWRIIVTEFDIEDQGFPPGSKGYDGAVNDVEKGMVMRLPRDLAEKAFKIAFKKMAN